MDGCPELLVTHEDGYRECLDPACTLPEPVHHDFRIPCTALDDPCPACTATAPGVERDRQWRAA